MKTQSLIIAAGLLAGLSTAAFAQAQPGAMGYNGRDNTTMTGRSVRPAENNGDPSAPAAGGGRESTSSGTYGNTQIPGHGGN